MRSTIGRPRALTKQKIKVILRWHARYLMWQSLRGSLKTQRELAQELGVSQSTISRLVRHGGDYKKGVP